ncbi:MAG: glycoside hydrolase family 5 protein [Ruminococcus sp.]|nr:glycoside hydrolase family 5 protein [Ruminococcus sp.]
MKSQRENMRFHKEVKFQVWGKLTMKNHNKMSRFAAIAAVAALTVTGLSILPESAIETKAASLTGQNAQSITSQMTIGWNLGNTLDVATTGLKSTTAPGKFVTKWGNPEPTQELFDTVKAGGFNTVRIPTTWYEHLEYDESSQMYVVNESWMDYVKQTVDYAYNQDMFVILNVHHEDFINEKVFTDETYAVAAKKLGDIWTQVSETFADYDQHLIFEGMNEPRQTGNPSVNEWGNGTGDNGYTTQYINNLNAVFVNTVRSQGSSANQERLLMLPGYCASSDSTAIRNIEIPANAGNVALSVHAYLPYYFTMATDSKAVHEFPGKSGWGEDYEYSLTTFFNNMKQISAEKNTPIIIGEFSASDFDNTESRVNWAKSYLSKAKDAGIPCVLWDNNVVSVNNGEAHGYVYRLTNTWYTQSAPVIEAMMGVYGITPTLPAYEEYVSPEFSWDKVPKDETWVELFRSAKGLDLEAWKPSALGQWKQYANENYDFVMIYETAGEPALVLQDEAKETWNYVSASDTDTPFLAYFTYEDLLSAIEGTDVTLEEEDNLYMSAMAQDLKVYGVYAVPKNGAEVPTETETDTESEPLPIETGDVNQDGTVSLLDIITLQKFLLGKPTGQQVMLNADMNHDSILNIYDLILLKKQLLKVR